MDLQDNGCQHRKATHVDVQKHKRLEVSKDLGYLKALYQPLTSLLKKNNHMFLQLLSFHKTSIYQLQI